MAEMRAVNEADLSGDMDMKIPLLEDDDVASTSSTGKDGSMSSSASIASSLMAMATSSTGSSVRQWVTDRRQKVQPWTQFVNTKRFSPPASIPTLGRRLARNVDHFQSNYIFVFVILIAYCLLTSPTLLLAIGASLGACYILKVKNEQRKLRLMGKEMSLAQQYVGVGVLSIPIFVIAGAGTVVFWVIGASIVFIVAHAALYNYESEIEDAFEMEDV